mgnify:CR=1 FL=1
MISSLAYFLTSFIHFSMSGNTSVTLFLSPIILDTSKLFKSILCRKSLAPIEIVTKSDSLKSFF